MFVKSINFRGTFESFWDLTEVSAQSWYKVRTYHLVNPTFKISLYVASRNSHETVWGKVWGGWCMGSIYILDVWGLYTNWMYGVYTHIANNT